MIEDPLPDPLLARICRELIARHGAHTILLYGSRANGSANEDSDYDIAAFAKGERIVRDARVFGGKYLDAFVYPEQTLTAPSAEQLHLRGSRILFQRERQAESFLEALDQIHAAGPESLPADELAAIRAWPAKMLARIGRDDIEGNYRRVWLLTTLLEDYFRLRRLWYQGPKKSLQWLVANDPKAYGAFAAALRPGASDESIAELAEIVVTAPTDSPSPPT
ncbi:MAG TPA: nucleotidyltransferase domain-containing protein [Paucimonas sp.]|nr:nucleotidyltransferase domain-containing protein [Paucimonas sp.]